MMINEILAILFIYQMIERPILQWNIDSISFITTTRIVRECGSG